MVRTPSASPSCSAWSSEAAPEPGENPVAVAAWRDPSVRWPRTPFAAALRRSSSPPVSAVSSSCHAAERCPRRRVADRLLELIDRLAHGNGPRRGVDLGAGGRDERGRCWRRHKIGAARQCDEGKTEARDPQLHAQDRGRTADSACAAYAAGLSRGTSGEIGLFRGSARVDIATRRTGRNAGVEKDRGVAVSTPR